MKKPIILCLALVLVFSMAGCGQKIEKITDFERFDSMTKETDRIDVTYDNNSGVPYYFSIIDQAEVDAVMEIIFSSVVEDAGNEPMAGDNTSLKIHQGNNQYSLHFRVNKEGEKYYNFVTDELQKKIRECYAGITEDNVKGIVDNSAGKDLDAALEVFYEDEGYEYSFNYVKSQYVEVLYNNGTSVSVSNALKNGHITIADLDNYDIDYTKSAK